MLVGARTQIEPPWGTLLATPIVLLPAFLGGGGPGAGHWTFPLLVPNDARLNGVRVAAQGWVFDPGASYGLAHTDGVEMTIGH